MVQSKHASRAQKHLSVERICKSTLSDFNRLIDSERLVPIIGSLHSQLSAQQAGRPQTADGLSELLRQTVAVDGTFLHAVSDVAWSVANSNNHGVVRYRARLDAQLNVSTWVPEAIVVPTPGQSEADSASELIQPGRIYLYDRGYSSFALLGAHYELTDDQPAGDPSGDDQSLAAKSLTAKSLTAKSHFVVRYKPAGNNSPELTGAVDRPLTAEDRAAGIVSDQVGNFTSTGAQRPLRNNGVRVSEISLREVILTDEDNTYEDNGEVKTLRLITNLLDVSAHTIVLLYQHRWQVELFFRWFKSFGHFGHLISHSREGVQAHLYVTIIAILLMYLHTGYRPSKYMFALVSQVAVGAATLEEILPILRERERRKELDRASAARRRAKKQAARG